MLNFVLMLSAVLEKEITHIRKVPKSGYVLSVLESNTCRKLNETMSSTNQTISLLGMREPSCRETATDNIIAAPVINPTSPVPYTYILLSRKGKSVLRPYPPTFHYNFAIAINWFYLTTVVCKKAERKVLLRWQECY